MITGQVACCLCSAVGALFDVGVVSMLARSLDFWEITWFFASCSEVEIVRIILGEWEKS